MPSINNPVTVANRSSIATPLAIQWLPQKMRVLVLVINTIGYDLMCSRITPEVTEAFINAGYDFELCSIKPIDGALLIGTNLSEAMAYAFEHGDHLIVVGAVGIAVRGIAPFLIGKFLDPSVTVIDLAGRFAVSLISGHSGGGNVLAQELEKWLGVTAVITTGTDALGKTACEPLISEVGLSLQFYREAILAVNAGILRGETITVEGREAPRLLEVGRKLGLDAIFTDELGSESNNIHLWFDTTPPENDWYIKLLSQGKKGFWLEVPTVMVGIGFRKGKNVFEIAKALESAISLAGLRGQQVRGFATISLKASESGYKSLMRQWKLPQAVVSLDAIQVVANQYVGSQFVQETLGIPAVAEPCAELALLDLEPNCNVVRYGRRFALDGVTVGFAAAKEDII